MTSQVTVGRVHGKLIPSAALPHVGGDAGWRLLVVGTNVAALVDCARRMSPAPSIKKAALDRLSEELVEQTDAVLYMAESEASEEEIIAGLSALSQVVGHFPLIAAVEASDENRRRVIASLKTAGATEVVRIVDLTPILLETVIAHAREKSELQSELMSLRDRFALAVRGALDGMWEYELGEGHVDYSQRWLELLELERGEIEDTLEDWFSRVHSRDLPALKQQLEAHISGHLPVFQTEHRVRMKDGELRWMLARGVAQRDPTGKAMRVSGSMTDISRFRERAEEARAQSRHDGITDLPRQQVFHERLARAVEVRKSYSDYGFAVLMVQVDRFPFLHGSFGKQGADQLLGMIAERVQSCVSTDEILSRYGDDRFAILLENLEDPTEGTAVADKIHRALESKFELGEQRVHVTVSIGMTSSARDYDSVADLITDVSAATDHASGQQVRGRAGHQMFKTNMRIEALTLLRLEIGLREALEREEFQLHYQPVVDISTGALRGFEALIRWNSPTSGRVSPGQFIPVAESTGLIVPIGRWALREAARQLKSWHDDFELHGRLSVNVNLSGRQVTDTALVATLEDALTSTGVSPECLKLELTESVLMENADFAIELIRRLRATGRFAGNSPSER
jgi:diguanylate cyclase (GGDEF)-like protein/PAS domain S-box-containing protein